MEENQLLFYPSVSLEVPGQCVSRGARQCVSRGARGNISPSHHHAWNNSVRQLE